MQKSTRMPQKQQPSPVNIPILFIHALNASATCDRLQQTSDAESVIRCEKHTDNLYPMTAKLHRANKSDQ